MSRLTDKIAFVTGIARGQGRAEAVRLAREGATIIGIDVAGPLPEKVPYDPATPAELDETRALIEAEGVKAHIAQCDIRDLDKMKGIVDEGVSLFGGLDIVVANAGICIPETWDEITPESFKDVLDVNVTGTWNTVTATAPHLVTRGGGSIVLISSLAGVKMQPFMVHYTTSKHAITGMTRAFAAELGIHNIRVNSVHPGAVNTPMGTGRMVERLGATLATNPRLQSMVTPFLNTWVAEPDEIASVVAFLASDDASFITAEQLSVDGGAQHF